MPRLPIAGRGWARRRSADDDPSMTPWIVAVFLVGPLIVVPLGLRLVPLAEDPTARRLSAVANVLSLPAGLGLATAFLLPAGIVAALLAIPWLTVAFVAAGAASLDIVRRPAPWWPDEAHAFAAARVFLLVGALFALTDRLGIRPFDFEDAALRSAFSRDQS